MANSITVFNFSSTDIRIVLKDNDPWFVAVDVCNVLGITNSRDALTRLKEYEKGVAIADTPGGKQELSIILESGLYRLVLTSRKPEAEPFQDWVCQEVIPTIRKTGSYQQKPKSQLQIIADMAQALADQEQAMLRMQLEQQLQSEKIAEIEALTHQHDGEIDRIFNPNGHYYSIVGYFSKFLKLSISI